MPTTGHWEAKEFDPHAQITLCAAQHRSGQTQGYFSFPGKSWIRISHKDMLPWQEISPHSPKCAAAAERTARALGQLRAVLDTQQ